jgi:hypothetical protein
MESEDDTTGPFRHQLLQLAKLHARPSVIYVSSKADVELVRLLRAPLAGAAPPPPPATPSRGTAGAGTDEASQDDEEGCFDVRTERSTLFLPKAARAMLEAVHVRGTPPGLTPRERLHRLNTHLSLSSEQQVCAAGALLAILAREGRLAPSGGGDVGADEDAGGGAAIELAAVQEVSLDGYLLVDPGSMAALQIFQEEQHPAAAMGIGGRSEGWRCDGGSRPMHCLSALAPHNEASYVFQLRVYPPVVYPCRPAQGGLLRFRLPQPLRHRPGTPPAAPLVPPPHRQPGGAGGPAGRGGVLHAPRRRCGRPAVGWGGLCLLGALR